MATITREQFCQIFNKIFGNDYDKFLDKIFKGFTTTSYKGFWHEETVFIIDLYNEEMITWYKAYHIGRSLRITKNDATPEYIENVFRELKEELNIRGNN